MKLNRLLLPAGLLGVVGLCSFSGCEKDRAEPAPEQMVAVTYQQTYCADPWGHWSQARTTQQLVTAATAYLQQQNIVATDVTAAAVNPQQTCNACQCKSGMVLEAFVRPQDEAAVLALGFVRK